MILQALFENKELCDFYSRDFPYELEIEFERFNTLALDCRSGDLSKLFLDVEMYTRYLQCQYWIGLLRYETKCLHTSLIVCKIFLDDFEKTWSKEESRFEFSYFFDMALSKLASISQRIAQLVNVFKELNLDVSTKESSDKDNVVTFYKVLRIVKETEVGDIMTDVTKISYFHHFIDIRHSALHSFHPLYVDIWTDIEKCIEDKEGEELQKITISRQSKHNKDILFLALEMYNTYRQLESNIINLMQIINKYFAENVSSELDINENDFE